MIKLFSLKNQKKDGDQPRNGPQKASAAQLRIQKGNFIFTSLLAAVFSCKKKARTTSHFNNYFLLFICPNPDINELTLPKTCATDFPDPDDLLNFKLIICPDEGFYKGGRFVFNFRVGPNYPHEPPKVKCETQVYHPNIDLEGNVCLNILREDWKPVLTINSVIYGLQYLFLFEEFLMNITSILCQLHHPENCLIETEIISTFSNINIQD
ncbi:UBE2M family protein [Megaselia abdita]